MTVVVTDKGFQSPEKDRFDRVETLGSDANIDDLGFDPKVTDCIRIAFPSFADGRGFTLARLLRIRGYQGHLRAFGHIIPDQYAMARRVGFNDIEIDADTAKRQPEQDWIFRSNWQDFDYQARLGKTA